MQANVTCPSATDSHCRKEDSDSEDLTQEEKFQLEHMSRQDPQGQEEVATLPGVDDWMLKGHLDAASSCGTLIIHGSISDDSWGRNPGSIQDLGTYLTSTPNLRRGQHFLASNLSVLSSPAGTLKRSLPGARTFSSFGNLATGAVNMNGNPQQPTHEAREQMKRLEQFAHDLNISLPPMPENPTKETLECADVSALSISDTLLTQTSGASSSFQYYAAAKPPPAYSSVRKNAQEMELARPRSKLRRTLSRSHPDLCKIGWELGLRSGEKSPVLRDLREKRIQSRSQSQDKETTALEFTSPDARLRHKQPAEDWTSAELVDALLEENFALRKKLHGHQENSEKLRRFEEELTSLHTAYETLVNSCEKRETLHRSVRLRLETEIRRLQEVNRAVRNQADLFSAQLAIRNAPSAAAQTANSPESAAQREVLRRDALIAQLMAQNKELLSAKERQDIELNMQRATLQDQRAHIEVLDAALTNAQANIIQLEEEVRRKETLDDKVVQLQKALMALQIASERRERSERRLRQDLEKEIYYLKNSNADLMSESIAKNDPEEMRKQLRLATEKTLALEAETAHWEQRYLEEAALRQAIVAAATLPKDEKSDSTKLRSTKFPARDDVWAYKRILDLESKLRDLESRYEEKDAMLRLISRASMDKESMLGVKGLPVNEIPGSSSTSGAYSSPASSLPPSIGGSAASVASSLSSNPAAAVVALQRASSVNANDVRWLQRGPSVNRKDRETPVPQSSTCVQPAVLVQSTKVPVAPTHPAVEVEKALDDQLKGLDTQLLSKDSLIAALRNEKERFPDHYWRL